MTKYSPIGPLPVLQGLLNRGMLGDYLLLLAHDVVKHPEAYEELAFNVTDEATIIMDNGTVENGAPVPIEDLMNAANIVNANIVVGPDVIGDLKGTKELILEQGDTIYTSGFDMMLIPQGKTLEEICDCIEWLHGRYHDSKDMWWGIPRWITNEICSRTAIITYINNYFRAEGRTNIHLLGMSQHLDDDVLSAKTLSVRGIDSANPLVAGWLGNSLTHDTHYDRGAYWDECTEVTDLMASNVEYVRGLISTGN